MLLARPEGRSTISFPLSSSYLCDARPATPLLLLRRVLLREPFGHSMTAESASIDTKIEMLWTWLLAPSSGIISSDGWLPARTMPTPGFEPGPPHVSMLRGKYVIYYADFVLFYYCYNLIRKYYILHRNPSGGGDDDDDGDWRPRGDIFHVGSKNGNIFLAIVRRVCIRRYAM